MAPPSPATSDPSSTQAQDVKPWSLTHPFPLYLPALVPATGPPPPPNKIDKPNAADYPHSLPHVICGGRVVSCTEALDPQQIRGRRRAEVQTWEQQFTKHFAL
jgi:hypothetical protein